MNSLITAAQLFAIGFVLGATGPCLFACSPILLSYTAGAGRRASDSFRDAAVFLAGRVGAYVLLGAAAGISAGVLTRLTGVLSHQLAAAAAGVITILLGIALLLNDRCGACARPLRAGGIFSAGFFIGMAPCVPLMAVLSEITLMSKNLFSASVYALSFGLGTFAAGILSFAFFSLFLVWGPARFIRSGRALKMMRIAGAVFLLMMGSALVAAVMIHSRLK